MYLNALERNTTTLPNRPKLTRNRNVRHVTNRVEKKHHAVRDRNTDDYLRFRVGQQTGMQVWANERGIRELEGYRT